MNIHTCVSVKFNAWARAFRSAPTTYWLLSNACSNFNNCPGENAVRTRFGFLNGCKRKSARKEKKKTKLTWVLSENKINWIIFKSIDSSSINHKEWNRAKKKQKTKTCLLMIELKYFECFQNVFGWFTRIHLAAGIQIMYEHTLPFKQ